MAEKLRPGIRRKERGEAQRALESAFATSFRVMKWVMYLVIIFLLFSGVFSVDQQETAVVLRFGKLKGLYGPGVHFALPYPIDEVHRIPVQQVKTITLQETFWHQETDAGSMPVPLAPSLTYGYTLTDDFNIIHSRWELNYRINDPVKYLLEIEDPDMLLREALISSVVEASARYTVDEATRERKDDFQATVERVFRSKLAQLGHQDTFIIQSIVLPAVKPPVQTEEAFNAVVNATQQRTTKLNTARGEASSFLNSAGGAIARELVIAIDEYRSLLKTGDAEAISQAEINVALLLSRAGGEASQIVSKAEAYSKRIATEAEADANRLTELKSQYGDSPRILMAEKLYSLYWDLLENREMFVMTVSSAREGRELRINITPDPDVRREERRRRLLGETEQTR